MSTPEHGDAVVSRADLEQRRNPRVEVLGRIQGNITPFNMPITLLNLSEGGFLMQAPINYSSGEIHEFRFTVDNRDPIVLRARVVHGMRATAGQVASYVIGLEFADREVAVCEQRIQSLIERLRDAS